ncbi:hypothetical protein Cflav_PD2593 [Pedosphaera parvula Ellin514]|uniref:Uncharacterized protein n=1 Tax=Pedosphaera parvula (strain Ellin514) TaxID=320771 RepID=B9XKD4_PEDPL|nr:hypothetical protein Cflav_PD2593 [Pedosphaera parvula Ellin514]
MVRINRERIGARGQGQIGTPRARAMGIIGQVQRLPVQIAPQGGGSLFNETLVWQREV